MPHMKPPVDTPLPEAAPFSPEAADSSPGATGVSPVPKEDGQEAPAALSGYFELEVPGLADAPPVRYVVQLPPEYDPYRRYPTIVTLHGAGTTATVDVLGNSNLNVGKSHIGEGGGTRCLIFPCP